MKKPSVTVFSIDPATGEQYMTTEHAERLAYTHIHKKCSNLMSKISADDLKQELMLKLCSVNYDPSKCAAVTWAITCFTSCSGNIWKYFFISKNRNCERPDFILEGKDGDMILATENDAEADETTPEWLVMARQELEHVDIEEFWEPENYSKRDKNLRRVSRLLS